MNNINTEYAELTFDAAIKAYWRKPAFRTFLMGCGVSDRTLATWAPEETKKIFLTKLFQRIWKAEEGPIVLAKMANTLAEREHYPDLELCEDSKFKVKAAKESRDRLKSFLKLQLKAQRDETEVVSARKRAEILRQSIREHTNDLNKLETRFNELALRLGEQKAGYDFQDWFYELMEHFEITHKRPYKFGGRQIDGSVSIGGTHYLVELKFTGGQTAGPDIDNLSARVRSMADNTMGIFISASGYSSVAINDATKSKVLLLLDATHLLLALKDILPFNEIVERIRRHASQTGESYLASKEFGH